MNKLTRRELIEAVARATGQSKRTVAQVLAEFERTVTTRLAQGDSVSVGAWGKFEVQALQAPASSRVTAADEQRLSTPEVQFVPAKRLVDVVSLQQPEKPKPPRKPLPRTQPGQLD